MFLKIKLDKSKINDKLVDSNIVKSKKNTKIICIRLQ